MKGVSRLLWSITERAIPRGTAAILLILAATYISPSTFGLYSWVVLALSLFQAFGDVACRQYAVFAVGSPLGRARLRKLQLASGLGGFVIVVVAVGATTYLNGADIQAMYELLPIAVGPIVTAAGLAQVANAQRSGMWRHLAIAQVVAAALTFPISVVSLVLSQSLVGLALQYPLSEIVFLAWVCLRNRKARAAPIPDAPHMNGDLGALTAYSIAGWLQSQADRLLVGAVAGTSSLALYATGTNLGRAAGDAISASSSNVVRGMLSRDSAITNEHDSPSRTIALAVGAAGLVSASLMAIMSTLGSYLPVDWQAATSLAMTISVATVPGVVIWGSTALLQAGGKVWLSLPVRICGVLAAVPISIIARFDLTAAGFSVTLRDTLLSLALYVLVRKVMRAYVVVFSTVLVLVLSAAAMLITIN